MPPITYSIDINTALERAFDCVDDNEKVVQWATGVEEITPLEPWNPADPIGSKFKQRINEGGRVTEYQGEIVAYEKPRHLGITLSGRSFTMRVDYRFSALDANRTRLDYRVDMTRGSWFGRITWGVFRGLTARIARQQMTALKALAEAG
jgi:carbon monoxide dehydrogenase subunit G